MVLLGIFCLWIEFIMMWVLISNKYISIYQRKQVNAPSDVRLVISLMNFLMLAIWDIWRSWATSRNWSHFFYYLCIIFRLGRQKKEVSFIKIHGNGEIVFIHIWHWSDLIVLFQQGVYFGDLKEDIPKKSHRYCYKP